MKSRAIIIIVIILAAAGVFYFVSRSPSPSAPQEVLGEDVELLSYTEGGTPIGKGILYLSFVRSLSEGALVHAYLDMNRDSVFSEDEKVVNGVRIHPRENWRNGFPISLKGEVENGIVTKIILNSETTVERTVSVAREDVGDLLDLASVTNPEESMKGWGVPNALAGEPAAEASRGGVPDLRQRPAECAPTAAANSIMSLAEEHGMSLSELPTPTEIVDGLKGPMGWTPADGVLPDNFVKGKNEWAAAEGLPIQTEKVGDKDGASTVEKILDAMAGGAAAEIRIRFADANGRVVGGHMVTVTGVRTEGGQTFVDVNDPKTPSGTETYEVNGNVLEGYPFQGLTVVSWGFVQRWVPPTGTALEPMTAEEIQGIREFAGEKQKIKVIIVNGKKVPISQVHVGKGPECDSETNQIPHYHANAESVTALDGTVIPDPGGCGYGKVRDVPVEEVEQ